MINLILAFWITNIINKKKEEDRVVKNLINDCIKNIIPQIDFVETQVKTKSMNWIQATSEIKKINISIKRVFELLTYYKLKLYEFKYDDLSSLISELKDLMTKTPMLTNSIPNIKVNNGIITYTENQVILIEQKTDELKCNLFKLQLEINIL